MKKRLDKTTHFTVTWMEQESIMLGEVRERDKENTRWSHTSVLHRAQKNGKWKVWNDCQHSILDYKTE